MERQSPVWPLLTVVIITYKRAAQIRETIRSYLGQSNYPRERTQFLIADDSSGGDYVQSLLNDPCLQGYTATASITPHNMGFGANANRALALVTTPYLYFTEDDWVAMRPLDIKRAIAVMESERQIEIMRMSGPTATAVRMDNAETDISAWLPEYKDGCGYVLAGKCNWYSIRGDGGTICVYSNRPHVRRVSNRFGPFVEGQPIGQTEHNYAWRSTTMVPPNGSLVIGCLPDYVVQAYQHIGDKSWQKSANDMTRGG
jgi:glycosyltransferase involved in cell wall biosynthesis